VYLIKLNCNKYTLKSIFNYSNEEEMNYILGGNYEEAYEYMRSRELSRAQTIIVNYPYQLKGVTGIRLLLVGSYEDRNDWESFQHEIQTRHIKAVKV
jgi:hypothetical protein